MAKAKLTGWKQKRPYVIQAPEKFDYKELGTTIASDPKLLVGRTISVALSDFTNDRSKQSLMISFEICDVAGDKAKTRFKRFALHPGYLKSKVRKGVGKIDYKTDLDLSGDRVRVKVTVLTHGKVTSPKRNDIIAGINKSLGKYSKMSLDEFVQQVLFGKVGTDIYRKVKKICPVGRVEVLEIKKI